MSSQVKYADISRMNSCPSNALKEINRPTLYFSRNMQITHDVVYVE